MGERCRRKMKGKKSGVLGAVIWHKTVIQIFGEKGM